MSHQSKSFWVAIAGGVGMIGTALWSAVTTTGWPPTMPASMPWTAILFGAFAFASFVSLLSENLHLKRPRLSLVFEPDKGPPFVEDKPLPDGVNTFRVFRVGVLNKGASADAQVKILTCTPHEPQASRVGYPLQVFGAAAKTDRAIINRSSRVMVYFEVCGQLLTPGVQNASELHLRPAIDNPQWKRLKDQDLYLLTLGIDGPGADKEQKFMILREQDGRWALRHKSTP